MTDYWKNRFIKSTKDVFDSDEEYVKEIFKIYESTIEDLDSEIFKLLNSMEDVSMAEAKKLLNKYEIRSFKSGLDEFRKASKCFISPDLEKELDIVSRRVRISRLQAMQVSMKSKVATLLNKEQKKLFAHLSNKFTSSYYKDLYELQRITGYKNINSLSKDFVNNILNTSWTNDGENFSDRIWKRKDKLLNILDTELRQGLITGKKPDEITKVISDKLEVSKSNAKRLVLTESSAMHSQSRKAMYERMGVEKYEVVATLDLRTSDICRKLDGKVFDVKDYERGVTAPPFHVYCRSTTVPYYNDDIQADIENSRLARDPETGKSLRVEKLTYKEWYKKYITKEVKQEQGQFFFKADLLTEKGYNNVRYYVSGAITDSYSKEARNHAQLYYEEIRNQKTDIDRISKNTGYDKRLIEEIKNYLFYEEHDIYGIKRRFDPDFSIAQSWQRLAQDEIEKHDLTLINHEIMERRLIAKGLTQDEAHKIASKKYNYRKESSEYYAKIKERRKKG
ncbi:minor capsid protein [Peptoniphilus rhinitidis]|uniref:minor capsid protein n=1 Tax=Peptoniphilus rhinitidis TaxID=1175452 RepID=UPI000289D69E|nr:minor capsid protein [Peptoniphilus rhinitidis]